MGLDMYLNAKKHIAGGFSSRTVSNQKSFEAVAKAVGLTKKDIDNETSVDVSFNVCYWRKANPIHDWFVTNCQDGEDDCEKYMVSRESLEKLRSLCQEVLKTGLTSKLPTKAGFFFGSVNYDDCYRDDLKDTIGQLSSILDNPKFDNWQFCYQSSW